MEMLFGAGIVLAAVCLIVWFKNRQTDEGLDMALTSIHAEARKKLPPEDMARLTHQLRELSEIAHSLPATGVSAKQASRIGKRAAIQTIAGFIEVERMLPR